MKKIKLRKKLILEKTVKFIRYCIKGLLQNSLSIAALFVAILSFNKANEQFEINSRNSDIQFKENIELQRSHFDSLYMHLEKYNQLTSNQLETTKKLLDVSQETLDKQLYSNRPILSVTQLDLKEDKENDSTFAPIITIAISNKGNRSCYEMEANLFMIYPDNTKKAGTSTYKIINEISPNITAHVEFLPNIRREFKDDFFLFLNLNYKDPIMSETFYQTYYYHYCKVRGNYGFYFLDDTEIAKFEFIIDLIEKFVKGN